MRVFHCWPFVNYWAVFFYSYLQSNPLAFEASRIDSLCCHGWYGFSALWRWCEKMIWVHACWSTTCGKSVFKTRFCCCVFLWTRAASNLTCEIFDKTFAEPLWHNSIKGFLGIRVETKKDDNCWMNSFQDDLWCEKVTGWFESQCEPVNSGQDVQSPPPSIPHSGGWWPSRMHKTDRVGNANRTLGTLVPTEEEAGCLQQQLGGNWVEQGWYLIFSSGPATEIRSLANARQPDYK